MEQRTTADIDKDIVVVASGKYMEIWEAKKYNEIDDDNFDYVASAEELLSGVVKADKDLREYAEVLSSNNSKSIFGLRGKRIRSMAMAKALHGTDYDMIINPQYETERKKVLFGLFTRYTMTVKGYGAKVNKLYQTDSPSEIKDIPLARD